MIVSKMQIKRGDKLDGDKFITIPLNMTFDTVDKTNTIEKSFVGVEVEKNINPIADYEKSRFTPISNSGVVNKIEIDLTLLNDNNLLVSDKLSTIGFIQNDIDFNKNSFNQSFIRLGLYDTDRLTTQRLMSFYTIYLKVLPEYLKPNVGSMGGMPLACETIPVKFRIKNPVKFLDDYSEGFNIYHYKDEISDNLPKVLFMRATFNNAKTGITHGLMTDNIIGGVDMLVNKIHMKYVLTKDNTGYYYRIDQSYSTNIEVNGDEVKIKLYEIISN